MKLKTALSKIHPAQGTTTIISALMSGDMRSIRSVDIIDKGITELEEELKKTEKEQSNCGSDWAYWGYEGTISYLKSAIYLLKAADIVGTDNLADIPVPDTDGMVMDVQGQIEQFGKRIYEEAIKARNIAKIIAQREMDKKNKKL
jgi:hypothetical protein